MTNLPPLELLETTHQFPCRYTFKAIGRDEDAFDSRVLDAVREVLELAEHPESSVRRTANGQHVAVTLELDMAAAEHVLRVYSRLQQLEGLVLLM